MSEFSARVRRLVRRVPYGRVTSYGAIAARLGHPRAARAVGAALRALPDGSDVPWWRVVNATGGVSRRSETHAAAIQRALLEAEGIRFDRNGRVDWRSHGWNADARPEIRSVALAIRHPRDVRRLLVVRRPDHDADLPGAWGLPAASLRPGEAWLAAAHRAARDKLGVVITITGERRRGRLTRPAARLHMRLYDARLLAGRPTVPQPHTGVTQYTAWRWAPPRELEPAAAAGSLCCRLALADEDGQTPAGPRPARS
jgi:methylated-DNA-protein-cysteine methyltransferase-like protein